MLRPPLMSVSATRGVLRRSEITDDAPRADDLGVYKLCLPGDIVVNRMSAYNGALGIASEQGLVSPDYMVLRPHIPAESRFLHHLCRSSWFVSEMAARVKGIGSLDQGSVRTPRISFDELGDIVVTLPEIGDQRRIADYLDAETARLDALIERRQQQQHLLRHNLHAKIAALVAGDQRQTSPFPWIARIDRAAKVVPVYSLYEVRLGKMLSQANSAGYRMLPYLRNANVTWAAIDLTDLALMSFDRDEDRRYRVQPGDLLVCEGGAGVAEAAVMTRSDHPVYYQKSLHRVRSRASTPVEWLMYWLQLIKSVGVLDAEGNLATIPHLTGEQLREMRLVVPPDVKSAVAELEAFRARSQRIVDSLSKSIALLTERRQALITAAVTGEFQVPESAA